MRAFYHRSTSGRNAAWIPDAPLTSMYGCASPFLAILFFMTVVAACAIFEWALIGNKLCFKNPPQDDDPFATMNKNQEAIAEERRKSDVAAQRKSSKGGESSSGIPDKKPSIKPSAVAPATVPPMPGAGAR